MALRVFSSGLLRLCILWTLSILAGRQGNQLNPRPCAARPFASWPLFVGRRLVQEYLEGRTAAALGPPAHAHLGQSTTSSPTRPHKVLTDLQAAD